MYNGLMDMKRCTKCGMIKPASVEHFSKEKRGKNGLCAQCKTCRAETIRKWYENNKERHAKKARKWREKNKERVAEWREKNKERVKETHHKWYENNKGRVAETQREWYANNKRCRAEYSRQWRENNKEYNREWRRNNPARECARNARRRARKRSLPDDYTADDWQHALDYFGGVCAICGRPPGLFHTLAMDHWIPLTSDDCPGTIPSNIIPLCHGDGGCNNSKSNCDPIEWLTTTYGKRRAATIIARIDMYIQSL